MSDKSKVLKRAICMGAVSYLALLIAGPSNVHAQTAQSPQATLPAVTVDAPKPRATQRQRASTRREGRGRSAARSQRRGGNAAAQPSVSAAPRAENPQGHFPGYAASRTLTGTKTDTPLSRIPQSVSVVGSDQIRDLKPQTLDQILRYAPGVGGETFGADTRNDWFYLRGFRAQQDALFLDGMSLFSTGFATWKLQPFGLERLEILRGPSSVLYGGGSPGGVVNAVSKMPTAGRSAISKRASTITATVICRSISAERCHCRPRAAPSTIASSAR